METSATAKPELGLAVVPGSTTTSSSSTSPPPQTHDVPEQRGAKRKAATAIACKGSAASRRVSAGTPQAKKELVTSMVTKGHPRGDVSSEPEDCIQGRLLGDSVVTLALAEILSLSEGTVRTLMKKWEKPILKCPIPGVCGRVPTQAMLAMAKAAVIKFLEDEEALGPRSHVSKAFYLASKETDLEFAWDWARKRVRRAKLDSRGKIDSWKDCLAMVSGDSNTKSEIYICGTRKVTQAALTSLICHEGLHNLARRKRRGNPFLGEDTEHIAMALIGDPQLAA